MLELMPCQEHSDPWGYNPRSLLSLHRPLGTPEVGWGDEQEWGWGRGLHSSAGALRSAAGQA